MFGISSYILVSYGITTIKLLFNCSAAVGLEYTSNETNMTIEM